MCGGGADMMTEEWEWDGCVWAKDEVCVDGSKSCGRVENRVEGSNGKHRGKERELGIRGQERQRESERTKVSKGTFATTRVGR